MAELRRALGRWDLTAIGVNQVIGGAIFLLPAQVAAQVGAWSPIGFVADRSRVARRSRCASPRSAAGSTAPADRTCYTRAAFGRFVGVRGRLDAVVLARREPGERHGWHRRRARLLLAGADDRLAARRLFIMALTAALAWINVRGIRQSAAGRQRADRRQARAARASSSSSALSTCTPPRSDDAAADLTCRRSRPRRCC